MSERYGVLVTGSRDWPDAPFIWNRLDEIRAEHGLLVVYHGWNPDGADGATEAWLAAHGDAAPMRFQAQWLRYGKRAGPLRNSLMVSTFAEHGSHAGAGVPPRW